IPREKIRDLGGNAAPVNRIDRTELGELLLPLQLLYKILAIIEAPANAHIENIAAAKRTHLRFLECAHAHFRTKHEKCDGIEAFECRLSGGARVSRRRAENGQMLAPLFKLIIHFLPELLHRHVLECGGGAERELLHIKIIFNAYKRDDISAI